MSNSENQLNPSSRGEGFYDFLGSPELQRQIDLLTIGIVLVGSDHRIFCSNRSFARFVGHEVPAGTLFYEALGESEIEGPDFCPFASVRHTGQPTVTSVRIGSCVFELTFSPHRSAEGDSCYIVVEMRDVTSTQEINETLRRLLEIGTELSDLPSNRLAANSPDDRKNLLQQKIKKGLREILHYDICEIRLLEESNGELLPFLAFGISSEAAKRKLFSSSNDNGITGYVAHNRVTYYCEETLDHPFYLPGASDARSSLTIPLIWRDRVIGTCNVESTKPSAFSEIDLYFLQIFMRDVAAALHTLELLSCEKIMAIQMSMGAVLESISLPIDEIVQNMAVLIDTNLEQDPNSVPPLRAVCERVRIIRDQISLIRRRMIAKENGDSPDGSHPVLRGRRILVVDREREIARGASAILEEFGCTVEWAPDAIIAHKMICVSHYDVIICELKPAGGMSGFQFMLRLFNFYPHLQVPPLILSTVFGYDPGHTLCSAKQKGLLDAILKPFPRSALLLKLESVINVCGERDAKGNLILLQNDEERISEMPHQNAAGMPQQDVAAFSSTESAGGSHRQKSFFTMRESQRFNEWEKKLMETDTDETKKKTEQPGGEDSFGFDAT